LENEPGVLIESNTHFNRHNCNMVLAYKFINANDSSYT
jgi:hypothetical protein